MDLTERRGRDGLALERREALVGLLAVGGDERALDVPERVRRDVVLQALELLREGPRQEPAEDGEHLTELDEDPAQPEHPAQQAPGVANVDPLPPRLQPGGHSLAPPPEDPDEGE